MMICHTDAYQFSFYDECAPRIDQRPGNVCVLDKFRLIATLSPTGRLRLLHGRHCNVSLKIDKRTNVTSTTCRRNIFPPAGAFRFSRKRKPVARLRNWEKRNLG